MTQGGAGMTAVILMQYTNIQTLLPTVKVMKYVLFFYHFDNKLLLLLMCCLYFCIVNRTVYVAG